jgi:hypothetical protein
VPFAPIHSLGLAYATLLGYLFLMNPRFSVFSRKHWRQMLSSYLRIRDFWLLHMTQQRPPLPMPIF